VAPLQVISEVLRQGGLRGFYAGIVPEYCKVVPGVALAFCAYEMMKGWMGVEEAG
jgi:solute carrier family 25 phosphate transporter 23/24/25/41